MKGKDKGKPAFFWRALITFIGIFLIISTLSNIFLFLFGATASAQVETRRFGGSNPGYPAEKRYEWTVEYSFIDNEGTQHTGYTKRRGADLSVEVSREVKYFSFAPFISSLSDEAIISPLQMVSIAIGGFLIYSVNWDLNKKRAKR